MKTRVLLNRSILCIGRPFFWGCVLCWFVPFLVLAQQAKATRDGQHSISISHISLDFNVTHGAVPYLYRLGLQMGGHTGDAGQYLAAEQRLGHFRISVGWSLREASHLADAMNRIRNSGYSSTAASVLAYGGEVTISITHMPRYLSNCAHETQPIPEDQGWYGFNRCPPADYVAWADLIEAIVAYFSVDLGLDVQYEIWNEPDIFFWAGTPEDYYKTYEWAVIGAQRALPGARMGGPAISDFFSGVTALPVADGWIADFVEYCGDRSIPIDFLAWHRFGMTADWGVYSIDTARRLLDEAGYSHQTQLLIDEWNIGVEYGTPHSDTEYNAAFAVSRLITWAQMGLDRHCFATFGDWHPDPPEFHGGQGLVTATGIKKPVYNAFRLLGFLEGQTVPLEIDSASPFLYATSSRSDGRCVLLVANAVPDLGRVLYVAIMDVVFAQPSGDLRSVVNEINDSVTTEDWVALLIDETMEATDTILSPVASQALENAVVMGRDMVFWSQKNLSLWVQVKNLPTDHVETQFLIDANHSNSFRAFENAINVGLDPAEALAMARQYQDLDCLFQGVTPTNSLRRFFLQPNSVLALIWHVADP